MKRRDVLEASALAAMVDLGAVAGSAAGAPDGRAVGDAAGATADGAAEGDRSPETPYEPLLARLPPLDAPAGRPGYDATFTRRLDDRHLPDPDLLADADAHASLVASGATVTLAFGGVDDAGERATARGYRAGEPLAGWPVYERRGRRRHRAVLAGNDAVLVGAGPEAGPVRTLLGAVATPEPSTSPYRTHRPVRTAVDLLAGGVAVAVSIEQGLAAGPDGVSAPRARDPEPLVTGERLTVGGDRVGVRSVAVYPTRAAAGRVLRRRSRVGPGGTATRDGRAVVRDRGLPTSAVFGEERA